MKTLHLRASASNSLSVDREAGVIRGVAVITAGMTKPSAMGQGAVRVDQMTLRQVAEAINARPAGLKVRVTHPEVTDADDLPHRVAFIVNARVDGQTVRADVEFHAPDDADAKRIMAIAERDPASCGLSITSEDFTIGDDGALRIGSLSAVDFVGEPAANPAGMLSTARGQLNMEFNDAQIAQLREFGMAEDGDPVAFYDNLEPEQQAEVDRLGKEDGGGERPEPGQDGANLSASRSNGGDALLMSERRRVSHIVGLSDRAGLGMGWARQQIEGGVSQERATALAFEHITNTRSPGSMATSKSAYVRADHNGDTIAPAITDALALRLGTMKNPHPRAAEFRGRSIIEMGRTWLMAAGAHDALTWSAAQVATKLMKSRSLALAQATGDFPSLLADALGKRLRMDYAEYPSTWQAWCGRTTAPDFKQIKRPALHSMKTPIEIPEGDEYQYVSFKESQEVYTLKTYGTGTKLTRQMLINDDLNAFDGLGQKAAQSCRRLEDDLAYQQITSNPTMSEDDVALFATAHSNIGSGAISNSNVSAGRVAMARQTDLEDAVLNLRPAHLLVPVELEDEARAHVAAQELRQTGSTDATYVTATYGFLRELQVVADPRLSADSETQWYLAANAGQIDTVELAFLEGEETPVVEEEDEFDTDVRKIKVRHNVAARAIDFRGLYRSSGS